MSLLGCSAYKTVTQLGPTDLSGIGFDKPRQIVISRLGAPKMIDTDAKGHKCIFAPIISMIFLNFNLNCITLPKLGLRYILQLIVSLSGIRFVVIIKVLFTLILNLSKRTKTQYRYGL